MCGSAIADVGCVAESGLGSDGNAQAPQAQNCLTEKASYLALPLVDSAQCQCRVNVQAEAGQRGPIGAGQGPRLAKHIIRLARNACQCAAALACEHTTSLHAQQRCAGAQRRCSPAGQERGLARNSPGLRQAHLLRLTLSLTHASAGITDTVSASAPISDCARPTTRTPCLAPRAACTEAAKTVWYRHELARTQRLH